MKSLKRISKMQTQIKRVLNQMVLIGGVALIGLFLIEAPAIAFSGSGAGTVADPYQITNATQLQEMADDLNAHYVLMNNIDCSDTVNWNSGKGFEPVGYFDGSHHPFTGTFDGQGYVITGLYINRPSTYFVGFFGNNNYATIKNVGLEDVDITGTYVGGLVANTHYGSISNCHITGNVNGASYVGGLVRGLFHSTVTDSYSTANVNGTSYVGGLAGYFCDGQIINCYSTGNVNGTSYVGGLIGGNVCLHNAYLYDSYSTGNVNGTRYVGGLMGHSNSYITISNSYSTGSVTGSDNIGGLVGKNDGTITNCYYNNHAGNPSVGIGSGPGDCTAINDNESYFYYSINPPMDLWNFVNVWGIYEGCSYPYLLWQPPIVDTTPPEITCPADVTVEQESYNGTVVTLEATATDCDPNPVITSDELAIYPLGVTIVTFTATDASGNSASCSMSVTVVDTTRPAINSISASPDVLWPPNHKMVDVTVTVDCTDICDPVPFCYIVGVTSNEPINGPGDGNTEPDWELFDDEPLVALLRAERAGGGTGRVYTIIVECIDASGNTDTSMVEVTVPHDQGKGKK